MKARKRKQYAYIGWTNNARKEAIVNIFMSIKKIKSRLASILFRRECARKGTNVPIAMWILSTSIPRIALIMKEDFADSAIYVSLITKSGRFVRITCMDFVRKVLIVIKSM